LRVLLDTQSFLWFVKGDERLSNNARNALGESNLDKYIILPFHHKDPFDRLIISQSLVEVIPIVSSDNIFDRYSIVNNIFVFYVKIF